MLLGSTQNTALVNIFAKRKADTNWPKTISQTVYVIVNCFKIYILQFTYRDRFCQQGTCINWSFVVCQIFGLESKQIIKGLFFVKKGWKRDTSQSVSHEHNTTCQTRVQI